MPSNRPTDSTATTAHRKDGKFVFASTCAVLAASYLVIGLVRGNLALAIGGAAIMVGYAVALLATRNRTETAWLLSSSPTDERQTQVMTRALAATSQVLLIVLLGGALVTLALGSDLAGVFCGLCAVGGATFILATRWFARHG